MRPRGGRSTVPPSRLLLAATAAGLAAPAAAHAGGFLIWEQSPSALAQGGAFTARADDASAIFYNPAGLAAHPRLSALAGLTAIVASTSATLPGGPTDSDTQVNTPPTLYAAVPIGGRVVAGVGLFTQYGLAMKWPATWAGRYEITEARARSYTVNPTVSVRAAPRLTLGAGLDVLRAAFSLRRTINFVQADGSAHLGGTSTSFGLNGGVLWETVPERFFLGLAYRSATDLHVTGDADFTVPPEWSAVFKDQKAQADVSTPHIVALGGSVRASRDLWLSLDLVYASWARLQTLTFEFPDDPRLNESNAENWRDTLSLRAGGEWAAGDFRVRGGLGFESTPVPETTLSPLIPDGNRFLLSAGAARDIGPVRAEIGYMLALFAGRDAKAPAFAPARYESTGHLIAVALQYRR